MDNFWMNFALEIGFLSLLGILYYFFQKRKLMRYEENKTPMIMNFLLQSCLAEKKDFAQPELDHLIESLDDFLNKQVTAPPVDLLKKYAQSPDCSATLKEAILETLTELG